MITNSKDFAFFDELKNLRAITMEEDMTEKTRKLRTDRAERLRETISEHNPEAMFADGFDESKIEIKDTYNPTFVIVRKQYCLHCWLKRINS